jgi:hypothetical protein
MAIVRNDTGVTMLLDGHAIVPGAICECSEQEADNLSRCGWTIVNEDVTDKNASNASSGSLRPAGKRGLNLEPVSPYMSLETYYLDASIGLPKPPKPFIKGGNLQYPMADNDRLGDCTIAGIIHYAQIAAAICGVNYTYPGDAVTESFYYGLTGGSDTGLELSQVISAVSKPNPLGFEIVGAATVNISDYDLLQTVLWNFGALYLAVDLPESAESDFSQRLPWILTNSPGNPIGGHCIVANGTEPDLPTNPPLNDKLFDIITWADKTECDLPWWLQYGVQAIVLLPKWYVTAKHDALQHLDEAHMLADLQTISNAR